MKTLASTQPRIVYANIFATGRVQLVPDIARQLHPRLRWTFAHRKKWRRLSLIARLNFHRYDLGDRNSENSGDENGGGGPRQDGWNRGTKCAEAGTQVFETEMP